MIDTHCHLGDPAFDADRAEVVARMGAAGVLGAVVIESDLDRYRATADWVAATPGLVLATGCHPHDASRWDAELAATTEVRWRSGTVAAAGEMGLDYHYDNSPRDVQRRVFAAQLALAVEVDLPVVIHAREADHDVVAILAEQPGATVVLHSFSSGAALRDAGLERGWYFSFSGMVTFRKWTDHDTVRAVPLDRLLAETDSPYLAPVPHRGSRNEPAHVARVIEALAGIRDEPLDTVVGATTGNARRLFWRARKRESEKARGQED